MTNLEAMNDNPSTETKRKRRRGSKARALLEKKESEGSCMEKRRKINTSEGTSSPVVNDEKNDKKKRKKKNKKGSAPKPGEEGYLTATQMRNARKRRAKQRKSEQAANATQKGDGGGEKKRKRKTSKRSKVKDDPSMKYIHDPKSSPLVQRAIHFFAEKDIPFQTHLGPLEGWRTVCKLPVRMLNDEKKSCVIGLFKPKSHEIVSIPNCPAHHPSINSTIQIIQQTCNRLNIQSYNESTGKGLFRYVCINVERSTGKVQVSIVWNSSPYLDNNAETPGKKELERLTRALIEEKDDLKLHSLWIHYNDQWKHADNIFNFGSNSEDDKGDSLWKLVHGPREIVDTLDLSDAGKPYQPGQVKLHFPPNTFRQANIDAFTKIIAAIRRYIIVYNKGRKKTDIGTELPSCVELYGGVGTIGLNICDLTQTFISSDENPYNKACFEKSVEKLPSNLRSKCRYVSKNATAMIQEENIFSREKDCSEIIIVDPPRKGLDEVILNEICGCNSRLLVYVSCGFDAFHRDCEVLLKNDWKLDKAEGHLLFPGSDAIETLAFFTKDH